MCGGVHNFRPSGGAELQGRGPRKCAVREQGPQQSTVRGRRSVWWGPQHPSVEGGAKLQGRGPRKSVVREQGPQQSTVLERRSVWWGPQHPSVGGGGATGARPAEVCCKGAGAAAKYCTGAEECVVGSTTSVRRGGLSYKGEARGIRPWVEIQVCKVTINCGYRCGRDRVSHLPKFRGRVISAIRYSVGARVYLSVLPSIMIRAPRMVAVRGPGDERREGQVLLP